MSMGVQNVEGAPDSGARSFASIVWGQALKCPKSFGVSAISSRGVPSLLYPLPRSHEANPE
jgi:hypothetical protein